MDTSRWFNSLTYTLGTLNSARCLLPIRYDDPADDEKTAESMATILDAEQPDLVIMYAIVMIADV